MTSEAGSPGWGMCDLATISRAAMAAPTRAARPHSAVEAQSVASSCVVPVSGSAEAAFAALGKRIALEVQDAA